MAIRVAVTGRTATPPLFDTLVALGRERTLQRLDRALAGPRSAPDLPAPRSCHFLSGTTTMLGSSPRPRGQARRGGMEGFIVLAVIVTAGLLLSVLAATEGVDSRQTLPDDHRR